MTKNLKMVIVLMTVALLSGGLLSFVYQKTKPEIEFQRLKALKRAIFNVLPDADDYKEVKKNGLIIYQGINRNNEQVGIVFIAEGNGFQGAIKMIVGMDNELKIILGMQVLESVETPGLGGKITGDDFQNQFKGIAIEEKVDIIKGKKPENIDTEATIQAITGATISSKAVVDIINKKIKLVRQVIKINEER